MYRWGEIARRQPLWASRGAGAGWSSRRVDRGDLDGVLGVADAFPRLVSPLARACNDHENDARRFVPAEARSGRLTHEFPLLVEREKRVGMRRGGNPLARPGRPHR